MIDVPTLYAETFLRHVEWLEVVDSTNNRAMELSRDPSIITPFLIGTQQQTAGRGRGSNRWWGASGALMFSVVIDLPPGLSTLEWPRFSLVTGLAIAETLSSIVPRAHVGLKWPNDVWLNGRKVCGILIEQADRRPGRFIVGIGVNVNNSFLEAPDSQRAIATSMKDETQGMDYSLTEILVSLMNHWKRLLDDLEQGTVNLVPRWSRACVLTGRPVTVQSGEHEMTGVCAGIAEDGALLLRTAFATERCYAGTVRLLE